MTFVLGLTGSIGMGKSTTAKMFADEGVPVWDADATVRALYAIGGKANALIAKELPQAMDGGTVSRDKLRELITTDPKILDRLEALVHPLVAENRNKFLQDADSPIVVLDVPLLFETGGEKYCDGVVVVSAPPDVQKARVLERGEMLEQDFDLILSRQMPDADKRAKARWVIETQTLDGARFSVQEIIDEIRLEVRDA